MLNKFFPVSIVKVVAGICFCGFGKLHFKLLKRIQNNGTIIRVGITCKKIILKKSIEFGIPLSHIDFCTQCVIMTLGGVGDFKIQKNYRISMLMHCQELPMNCVLVYKESVYFVSCYSPYIQVNSLKKSSFCCLYLKKQNKKKANKQTKNKHTKTKAKNTNNGNQKYPVIISNYNFKYPVILLFLNI